MHKLLGKKSGINKGWEIFLEFFYSRICLCCLRKSNFCFQTWASKINKTSFSAKNDHFRLNLVRTTVSPPRCRSRPSHYILFLLSLTLCLLDYFVSAPERRLHDFFFLFFCKTKRSESFPHLRPFILIATYLNFTLLSSYEG